MKEVHIDNVKCASAVNGVVVIQCDAVLPDGSSDPCVVRVPLQVFQEFAVNVRRTLLDLMAKGYYGDEGRKAFQEMAAARDPGPSVEINKEK